MAILMGLGMPVVTVVFYFGITVYASRSRSAGSARLLFGRS